MKFARSSLMVLCGVVFVAILCTTDSVFCCFVYCALAGTLAYLCWIPVIVLTGWREFDNWLEKRNHVWFLVCCWVVHTAAFAVWYTVLVVAILFYDGKHWSFVPDLSAFNTTVYIRDALLVTAVSQCAAITLNWETFK